MIRGIKKQIPSRDIHYDLKADIHNRFDIEVVDATSGVVRQKAVAQNVICENLWNRALASQLYFDYIHYGSGTGTPSTSDSSLFSPIGNQATVYDGYTFDREHGVFSVKKHITLTAGTAVGAELTEVGVAYSSSNGSLCTHAMLKDMNGNPISILKTDTDVINIYATIFVRFNPAGYDNGTIHILEPGQTNSYSPFYFGIWGTLAGHDRRSGFPVNVRGSKNHKNRSGGSYRGSASYDVNSKTVTITGTRMESTEFNDGGLVEIYLDAYLWEDGSGLSTSYSYVPFIVALIGGNWFPYSEVKNEAVGTGDATTTEFLLRFPYAHDASVYVNGELISDTQYSLHYVPNTDDVSEVVLWINPDSTADRITPDRYIAGFRETNATFYNPAHGECGLSSVYGRSADSMIYASNDLSEWVLVGSGTSVSVPAQYQHYKYWKSSTYFVETVGRFNADCTTAIKFNSAPPDGATIVADYRCDCIAKDSNHVFDFSLTIHLGEYTESQ